MIDNPKRILALCDFACASGFAQVAENIIANLAVTDQYQIDIVAINYYGMPNKWLTAFPSIRLFPAGFVSNGDMFGRQGLLQLLTSGQYDILWTLQDTFIVETIAKQILEIRNTLISNGSKSFKWIYYYPIDASPKENWIKDSVAMADVPVAYTTYGKEETLKWAPDIKSKLLDIPHGVDTKAFYPLEAEKIKEFRHKYFKGLADDKFLITNVNRNQKRKDIPRTLQILSLLKKQVPNCILYLHMKKSDVGWNLLEAARNYDLQPELDFIIPEQFDENQGLPIEIMNHIYNASDVVVTTTLGEGWGLSLTEAMATKTLVVAPNQTSITEIVKDHGVLIAAGISVTDWIVLDNDNERMRPIVSVPHFVDALAKIAQDPSKYDHLREAGYIYAQSLDWDIVGNTWRDVFMNAATIKKINVVGRNDPCYCGSGKKYKHCHGLT